MVSLPTHSTRGLARGEAVWALLGLAIMAWVILGTLNRELEAASSREAQDMVEVLAAHVHIALEDRGGRPNWWEEDLPAVGPGSLPPRFEGDTHALADFLPDRFPLEPDPWGRAFILEARELQGRIGIFLFSTGPEGILPRNPRHGLPWVREILGPVGVDPPHPTNP